MLKQLPDKVFTMLLPHNDTNAIIAFVIDIINKILLKDIEKGDIEPIVPPTATFKDLCKLAISYSDGVIQQSENVDPELLEYAREKGIPVLEYQPIETFADAINQFYDEIWSQGN